jgi:anaerobic magnesium-protoporphyrin IX monomethyl ester cyclase
MGIRVLFVYPNTYGMNMFPPAIALFSTLLKDRGHQVDLFDATYYQANYGIDSDGAKADRLNVVPFNPDEHGIKIRKTDWREDLRDQVKSFGPDLIAMSTTEDMWPLGCQLLESIEDFINGNQVPVVAGGVFPTFAPDIVIKHPLIGMVCVGEGEVALVDLCARLDKGVSCDDVSNLWVKGQYGIIKKNPILKPVDVNNPTKLDISLFEEKRLYRPMAGKWYRMLPVETHRGCPYTCAYCNSPDQNALYEESTNTSYFRKKRIDLIHQELSYFKDEIKAEYFYFWADTFLAWTNAEFEEFCDMYSEIKVPFWMQTRPETLTDYKIKRLSGVGLHRMAAAIEHGNDGFRAQVLNRRWRNEDIIESLKIPHKYGVQFSVNNITGFPGETRELALDTIEINRQIDSDNQNMYAFAPFHGTPLRKTCEELGLISPETITKALTDDSLLKMDQYPIEEIQGLIKCFVLYVKFPKSRWPDIKKAESNTSEGEKIYNELKQEYIDRYLQTAGDDLKETPGVPDLEYGVEESEIC